MPRGFTDYDSARIQGRLWTPLMSSNIRVWLDGRAPDTMTLEAGGKISSWRDRFGRNLTQSVDANRPLLQFDSGGYPNGVGGVAGASLGTSSVLSGTTYTFVLLLLDAGTSTDLVPFYNGNGGSSGYGAIYNYASNNAYGGLHGGVQFLAPATSRSIGSVICHSQYYTGSGSDYRIDINNVSTLFSAGINNPSGTLSVGDSPTMFGCIMADSVLSQYEREQAEAFLWWHHGFGDQIPKVNLFSNRPPLIGD
jgi:hypothetical protein